MDTCEQLYKIDFEDLSEQLLPYFWRGDQDGQKSAFLAFYGLPFNELKNSNNGLIDFCRRLKNLVGYTGQHLGIEALLNDNFDNEQRRIYIEELDVFSIDGIGVCLNVEQNLFDGWDVPLNGETTLGSFGVGLNSESTVLANEINFRIHVPTDVYVADDYINTLVRLYALATKKWDITRF